MKLNQCFICQSLLTAAVCTAGHAEPFSYQGQLQDNGQPANGTYDLTFTLFDSATDGSQVGSVVELYDVVISDGLVTAQVDFGVAFDAADRWIEIAVRDGASVGGYTMLLPRQQIEAAPKAQFAMVADTVANPQWMEAPGVLAYGDGDDKVFINRTLPITTSEIFGVHSDNPGFVGMYVSGVPGARPFYGY